MTADEITILRSEIQSLQNDVAESRAESRVEMASLRADIPGMIARELESKSTVLKARRYDLIAGVSSKVLMAIVLSSASALAGALIVSWLRT